MISGTDLTPRGSTAERSYGRSLQPALRSAHPIFGPLRSHALSVMLRVYFMYGEFLLSKIDFDHVVFRMYYDVASMSF